MPAPLSPRSSPQDADPREHELKDLAGKHLVSLRLALTSQPRHSTCHICESQKIVSTVASGSTNSTIEAVY